MLNNLSTQSKSYIWQDLIDIALRHKREIVLAHIIAVAATLLSVPIPLLMPLLVDEVLLDQPATLVNTINSIFPLDWQGPILTITVSIKHKNHQIKANQKIKA